jgi:hypothetical protein
MYTVNIPNANKLWRSQKRERNYLKFYDNKIVAIEAISALIASNNYFLVYLKTQFVPRCKHFSSRL